MGGVWVGGVKKKKTIQQKVLKKLFVQQTVKNKKFVHESGRKNGVIWGDLLVPLPERKTRFVSG